MEEIVTYLDGGGSLDGTGEPLRVWLTCYRVLEACQDLNAFSILENAHQLLTERANKISDDRMRQKFLDNIPYHLEIMKDWQEHQRLK